MALDSINSCTFTGRLGADPELRYIPNSQDAVCNFSIATSESWQGQDGKTHENTVWVNIVIFGKLAEAAKKHLHKGYDIAVFNAKFRQRTWEDQNGQKQSKPEFVLRGGEGEWRILSKPEKNNANAAPDNYSGSRSSTRQPRKPPQSGGHYPEDDMPM